MTVPTLNLSKGPSSQMETSVLMCRVFKVDREVISNINMMLPQSIYVLNSVNNYNELVCVLCMGMFDFMVDT